MFVGGGVIFALVVAILAFVLLRRHDAPRRLPATAFIVAGGVVLPVVTLTLLLAYTLRVGATLSEPPDDPLVVEVVGHRWWWEIVYHPETLDRRFTTANELHLPVGRPLELRLRSSDVIHSLWVPNLAGKIDLIPGRTNRLVVEAGRAGEFRGQCAEYCGAQHAHMAFLAIALDPEEFAAWEERQRAPAAAMPSSPVAAPTATRSAAPRRAGPPRPTSPISAAAGRSPPGSCRTPRVRSRPGSSTRSTSSRAT
jgi:cytochrome c oxidase subunit 2